MNKPLTDGETLLTLLGALVKKAGGSLTITEQELIAVSKDDTMVLLYDVNAGELILKLISTKGESELN